MLMGMYGKVCVPSAPVCLVSVLVEETHFISKTAHRVDLCYSLCATMLLNTNYKLFC